MRESGKIKERTGSDRSGDRGRSLLLSGQSESLAGSEHTVQLDLSLGECDAADDEVQKTFAADRPSLLVPTSTRKVSRHEHRQGHKQAAPA